MEEMQPNEAKTTIKGGLSSKRRQVNTVGKEPEEQHYNNKRKRGQVKKVEKKHEEVFLVIRRLEKKVKHFSTHPRIMKMKRMSSKKEMSRYETKIGQSRKIGQL